MAVTLSGVSGNSGTLSAAGVGSGLDVKSLVSQLMAVEQRPLTLLATQEAAYQAKLTSLGTVSGALSSLQAAAQALVAASSASYQASVSDSSVLSAAAGSTAVAGSYALAVTSLAQQQKLIAAGVAGMDTAIGSGGAATLTLQLGTISGGTLANGIYSGASFNADADKTPVVVNINSTNNTLAGIRDAINAAHAGVTGSIVNDGSQTPYRLSLASDSSGASNSVSLSVSGDAALSALLSYDPSGAMQNLTQTQAAQNAQFSVDGISISSTSNTVTDAIQGVTLYLAKANPAPSPATATISVQRDQSNLSAAVNALVQAYNSANKSIAGVTAKGAVLQGDWAVLGLQREVRTILGSVQPGGAYTSLSQLGVSFQKDGSLALDASKLSAALNSGFEAAASVTIAIGGAIQSAAEDLIGSTGPLAGKTDGIKRSITDIGSRRTDLQSRLIAVQQRYQRQFNALDTLLASMSATSTFLTQQLSNLPNYYDNNG